MDKQKSVKTSAHQSSKTKSQISPIELKSQSSNKEQLKSEIKQLQQIDIDSHLSYITHSKYKNTYLAKISPYQVGSKTQLLLILQKHGFMFTTKYVKSLKKSIYAKEGNSIKFLVKVGYFETFATILKVHFSANKFFTRSVKFVGTYGCIYKINLDYESYAIKSQTITPKDRVELNQKLDAILEEYFYYRIASALKCGPKMEKIFGYDIICYDDSIEFAMEFCLEKSQIDQEKSENQEQNEECSDQKDIKEKYKKGEKDKKEKKEKKEKKNQEFNKAKKELFENLKTMHTLRMVHRDVKDANIGWSSIFGKWVFLDFGFAKFLQQNIGEKTVSKFIGTFKYVIDQLQELYYLGYSQKIDFYYNDIHGLEKSLPHINYTIKKQEQFCAEDIVDIFINSKKKLKIGYSEEDDKVMIFSFLFFQMKLSLFESNFTRVQSLKERYPQLTEAFESLFLYELETDCHQKKENILRILRQNSDKEISQSESKIKKTKILNFLNKFLKKYSLHEKEKEKDDWENFVFYFETDEGLKQNIEENWPRINFVKLTLNFIEQCTYNKSEKMQKRLKQVIETLSKLILPNNKDKSWFWKFRHILYEIESIFLKQNKLSYNFELQKILHSYFIINDTMRAKSLQKVQIENNSNKINDGHKIMCEVLTEIGQDYNLESLKAKKKQVEELQVEEKFKELFFDIMEIIIRCCEKEQLSLQDHNALESLKNEDKYKEDKNFISQIFFQVEGWKKIFLYRFPNGQIKLNIPQSNFSQKVFNITKFIGKSISQQSSQQTEAFFRQFPFFKNIPTIRNLWYFWKSKKHEKVEEIIQDLVDMWEQCLEEHFEDIYKMLSCSKKKKSLGVRLHSLFRRKNLHKLELNKIILYWRFLKIIYCEIIRKEESEEEKPKFLQTLNLIICKFNDEKMDIDQEVSLSIIKILTLKLEGKKQQSLSLLFALHNKSLKSRKDWKESSHRQILSLMCLEKDDYNSAILSERIYQEWQTNNVKERNWNFEYTHNFYFQIIKLLTEKNRINDLYQTTKDLTFQLTCQNRRHNFMDAVFEFIPKILSKQQLLSQTIIILKTQTYGSIKKDNYLSALIFILYLKMEKKLEEKEKRRLLILSMLSLDRFPYQLKLKLRNALVLRCKMLEEWKTRRKKTLMKKRQAYASENFERFKEKIENKLRRCSERVQRMMRKKMRKVRKNLEKPFIE